MVAKPKIINEGKDWKEIVLYDAPFTFYNIHRIDFDSEYEFETGDKAFAINLVEGEKINIVSANNRSTDLAYMESMVIPAASKKIKLVNKGNRPCKLIMVYIKPGAGKSFPFK